MNKIGICWNAYSRLSCEEQIRLIKKNGFDATFLDTYDSRWNEAMPLLRANGIACESAHAPFGNINSIWMPGEEGDRMLEQLIQAAELCSRDEVPVLVVHLSSGENAPRIGDVGNARFDKFMEAADHLGVQIAFENLRKLGNLAYALEQYPQAGFCWDVGHETCLTKELIRFMPLFGNRLTALHLHDNHGGYDQDEHLLPYDGTIDMELTAKYLADCGYQKAITLEVLRGQCSFYANVDAETYYARAAAAARKIADRVAYYRSEKK